MAQPSPFESSSHFGRSNVSLPLLTTVTLGSLPVHVCSANFMMVSSVARFSAACES